MEYQYCCLNKALPALFPVASEISEITETIQLLFGVVRLLSVESRKDRRACHRSWHHKGRSCKSQSAGYVSPLTQWVTVSSILLRNRRWALRDGIKTVRLA